MAVNRGFLFTVLLVAAAAELVGHAAAATYVVGDTLGWRVPSTTSAYTAWASQHVFQLGDVLVFNFTTGQHNVAHVTKGEFDSCNSTNPIALVTTGPANVTLNSTGPDYYICTVGPHCSLGQKLAINVTASASPAPAPTPAPMAPSPTAPAPAPTPKLSPSLTPGSTPSPAPRGGEAPSPSRGLSPPLPSAPTGDLTPPPPPNVATLGAISSPLVMFASIGFGFMM